MTTPDEVNLENAANGSQSPQEPELAGGGEGSLAGSFVAGELGAIAQRVARATIAPTPRSPNERDVLQHCVVEALRAVVSAPFEVAAHARLGLGEDLWPRLGAADAALRRNGQTVLLELKAYELGPCCWDVFKCAVAIREGVASAAYLLACAPVAVWNGKAPGPELFEDAQWSAPDMYDRYGSWWRKWRQESGMPPAVPATGSTRRVAAAAFDHGGAPWELRLVRVMVDPAGTWPFPTA